MNRDPKGGYSSLTPTPESHPHLRLNECMISVPKVNPGDTVFWHCDVIHAVEDEHTGTGESAGKSLSISGLPCSECLAILGADAYQVMYIPAVPLTPLNQAYIERQKANFLSGETPPDFPGKGEASFVGLATVNDVGSRVGRRAMGFQEA